jgi:multicomponent Na+:H+ antiporter subunit D
MRCVNIDADWFYRMGGRLFYAVVDKVFNGINRASDRFIAKGFPRFFGHLSRHMPDMLTLGILMPLWAAGGAKGKSLAAKADKARSALATGSAPVGISAAVATIFLIVVFLLM